MLGKLVEMFTKLLILIQSNSKLDKREIMSFFHVVHFVFFVDNWQRQPSIYILCANDSLNGYEISYRTNRIHIFYRHLCIVDGAKTAMKWSSSATAILSCSFTHIHTLMQTNKQTYAEKSITSADKNWRRVPSIHYKMSWVYVWCEPRSVSGVVVASSMLSIFVSFRCCDANAGEAMRRVWDTGGRAGGVDLTTGGSGSGGNANNKAKVAKRRQ